MRTVDNTTEWIRSSYCESGTCLEVSIIDSRIVGLRDSKKICNSPILRFTSAGWDAFLTAIRNDNLALRAGR